MRGPQKCDEYTGVTNKPVTNKPDSPVLPRLLHVQGNRATYPTCNHFSKSVIWERLALGLLWKLSQTHPFICKSLRMYTGKEGGGSNRILHDNIKDHVASRILGGVMGNFRIISRVELFNCS